MPSSNWPRVTQRKCLLLNACFKDCMRDTVGRTELTYSLSLIITAGISSRMMPTTVKIANVARQASSTSNPAFLNMPTSAGVT